MNDEEVAFRIVRLYFEEIARLGFKRQLDIDQIINAYFYTLKKLSNKDVLMKEAIKKIVEDERKSGEVIKSTTTTVTQTTALPNSNSVVKEKSITEIVEEN